MGLSPRAQVSLTVMGFAVALAAACVSRKDIVPPLTPNPPSPAARLGLHVWTEVGSPACESLRAEMGKAPATVALSRFAVIQEQGGGLKAFAWGIHGYPTLIVTDAQDRELSRHEGAMGAAALAAWLDDFK